MTTLDSPALPSASGMSRTLWAGRLVALGAFLDLFSQVTVVPFYARQLGAHPALVGLIVAAYSFANLFGNLAAGPLLDRLGRKAPLLLSLVAAAVALLLYTLVQTPEQLLAVRVLHGLAAAVLSPGAFTLLGDAAPPGQRARAFGSAGALIALAAVAGPALAGVALQRFGGPQVVFITMALVLLATALFVLVFAQERTLRAPRGIEQPSGSLVAVLRERGALVVFGAILALNVSFGAVVTHLSLVLETRGEPRSANGIALSIYAVVALVAFLVNARFADRWGRERPLAVGLALVAIGQVGLALASGLTLVNLAMGLVGMGFAVVFTAATALLTDVTPPNQRGAAFGIYYAVYSLGIVIGSVLSGELAERFGSITGTPFLAGGVVTAAAALVVLVIRRSAARPE